MFLTLKIADEDSTLKTGLSMMAGSIWNNPNITHSTPPPNRRYLHATDLRLLTHDRLCNDDRLWLWLLRWHLGDWLCDVDIWLGLIAILGWNDDRDDGRPHRLRGWSALLLHHCILIFALVAFVVVHRVDIHHRLRRRLWHPWIITKTMLLKMAGPFQATYWNT